MTRKLHSAKNGNTFHPIAGPHCVVVCSIHLRFLYPRLHSFLTILGFYVGCMGPRTTKSAIIPFYEFGYWDLVFNSLLHEVVKTTLEKCTKSSFQLSPHSIICAKFLQFSIGNPPFVHLSMRQSSVNVFSNWRIWHLMLSPKWYVVLTSQYLHTKHQTT